MNSIESKGNKEYNDFIAPVVEMFHEKATEIVSEITDDEKITALKLAISMLREYKEERCCDALQESLAKVHKTNSIYAFQGMLNYIFPDYTKNNARKISGVRGRGEKWFNQYDFPARIKFLEWILAKYEK
ncbi:hypothetical protein FACS189434_13340 [Bacteroidia bacterium]|nr:hypothetical protein FACS189434_13340 [Bacteroidia bacterium]